METKYPNLLSPCQVGQVLFSNSSTSSKVNLPAA